MDKTVEIEITKAELEEKFFKGTSSAAAVYEPLADKYSSPDRH
jgi:hypothetical protein